MGIKVKFRKGAWWAFVNHRGRRRAKRIGDSEEAANRVKEALEARLGDGDTKFLDRELPAQTLKAYAERWLKTDARRCKPSTVDFYDDYLHRYVIPRFGEKRLTEITRASIKEFLADLAERESRQKGKLSRNTIRMALASLRVMLQSAVEDGILAANPAVRMGRYV
ncbi:MAG: phage integrase SAM-like domain-containing protein, partial [Gammaproteobacteria bacterium]